MVYLQLQFHDPLRFLTAEKYWDRHAAPPWVGIVEAVKTLVGFHFVGLIDLASIDILRDRPFREYRLQRDPENEVTWENRDRIEIVELEGLCGPHISD